MLCTTPAQGHTAPLLALARRLVDEGNEVVFFTTAHYREAVEATGASFTPFAEEYDAHDLMVANPERESSSKRGVRGVKDDLRRIFVGPIPGQHRDLRAVLDGFPADCIVMDTMFLGALPLALGPRDARPALACIGVMPYASTSRDTAPFGAAFQPGSGPLHRVRNVAMNWATEHVVLAGIQHLARRRLAEAGAPRFRGYLVDLQPKVVDAYLQATVAGFEYPALGPAAIGALRRPDPRSPVDLLRAATVVGGARGHPTGRARDPGHTGQRGPGPAPPFDHPGPGGPGRAGGGHDRGARPGAAAA